jgi:hypothetical protein
MQIANYYFITKPYSPLKLFDITFMSGFFEKQLMNIIKKNAVLRRKYAALIKEITDFEVKRKIIF